MSQHEDSPRRGRREDEQRDGTLLDACCACFRSKKQQDAGATGNKQDEFSSMAELSGNAPSRVGPRDEEAEGWWWDHRSQLKTGETV